MKSLKNEALPKNPIDINNLPIINWIYVANLMGNRFERANHIPDKSAWIADVQSRLTGAKLVLAQLKAELLKAKNKSKKGH